MLAVRLAPSVISTIRPSRYGVASLPVMPSRVHVGERLVDDRADLVGGDLVLGRDRVGDHDPRAEPERPRGAHHRGHLGGRVDPHRRGMPAGAGEERRELVAAVHQHRDAQRLQRLQRQPDVEDALHPGADHRDRGAAELGQVGGDVEGLLRAAVYAAEPAGHEHRDAGQRCQPHRRGHGGGAVQAAGDDVRQVADAHLHHVRVAAEELEVVGARGRSAAGRRGSRSSPAPHRRRGRCPRPRPPSRRCAGRACRG